MNKFKHELFELFNKYSSEHQQVPKTIIEIMYEYCDPYFDEIKSFQGETITAIKVLTYNRLATASLHKKICIYNLKDQNIISERPKEKITSKQLKYFKENNIMNSISAICQVDDNKIICGMTHDDYMLVWDFKDNAEYTIDCCQCFNDSIILIEENIIAYFTVNKSIKILQLKTKEIIYYYYNYDFNSYTDFSLINNKIFICCNNICIIAKQNFITNNNHNENKCYTSCTEKYAYNKMIYSPEYNNIVVVESSYSLNKINIIMYHNHNDTVMRIGIIENIKGTINQIICLNNNNIATLINYDIIIFDIVTGQKIQIIEHKTGIFSFLHYLDHNKFIAIDSDSNITIHEY